jgi:hypothetical protein
MNFGLNSVKFRNVKHKIRFGPHRNGRISPKFGLIRSNPRTLDASSVRSVIGGLYFDIIGLGRSFVDFRIKWVCREANSVADVCASMVSAMERSFFWVDYIPDWLLGLAEADCTPASY